MKIKKRIRNILFRRIKLVGVMKPPRDPLKKIDVDVGRQGRNGIAGKVSRNVTGERIYWVCEEDS
ncbi:MAG: hypothetical protein WDO15_15755 [Bacteroidota bacterium]